MALAIFDLDETLISEDSDYLWGEFVVKKGMVNKERHREKNREFYEQYKRGDLDIREYLRFSCSVLVDNDADSLFRLRDEFIDEWIRPLILARGREAIQRHKDQDDQCLIITSTMEFITRPIAGLLGIDELIAPIPEFRDGRFTGEIIGTPSFGGGKVTRLKEWMNDRSVSLGSSWCYSDSINDLPLLELVDNPIAVDPDDRLKQHAMDHGWAIVSFRD